jgi:hypothetical protein
MEHGSDSGLDHGFRFEIEFDCLTLMGSRSGSKNGSDEMEAWALNFLAWARRTDLQVVVFHFGPFLVAGRVGSNSGRILKMTLCCFFLHLLGFLDRRRLVVKRFHFAYVVETSQ